MEKDGAHVLGLLLAISACFIAILVPVAGEITYPPEVAALKAVRHSLNDPMKNLANWKKGDPCASNWTGVICIFDSKDGYLHVTELRLMKKNLSGILDPNLGQLSRMTILNFMWNDLSGSIPKQIGQITALQYLLISGNQISGLLPDELGYLPNLVIFQIDSNYISGPLPITFANLTSAKHFHMNNNSISGQIPPEISTLPKLLHFLLDNNNLSGYLPADLSKMPSLKILQLDNNNFEGSTIPESYGSMKKLLKLSLRNCSLEGAVPDLSEIPGLLYLDLSRNKLTGNIPTNRLSNNITTIDLSGNKLNGSIPSNFSGFTNLQMMSLGSNNLSGTVMSSIWQNINLTAATKVTLDFQDNVLNNISDSFDPPPNVTIKLEGNPVCLEANKLNIVEFCGNTTADNKAPTLPSNNSNTDTCPLDLCEKAKNYEYVPDFPYSCFCAAPLKMGLLLRSPSIAYFPPYTSAFSLWITSNLGISPYQLHVQNILWDEGPRLLMRLSIFPVYPTNMFNKSELQRIVDDFATFTIPGNDIFGPYAPLNFTLLGPYKDAMLTLPKHKIRKGALAGIVVGAICGTALILVAFLFIIPRLHRRWNGLSHQASTKKLSSKLPVKIEGVKEFNFKDLKVATNNFSKEHEVGQGGYGRVYKGVLGDGTLVAIKRAQAGSLQGNTEFFTEIQMLSRLHHRNLVSLLGYCLEEGEQILVYEFMPNGSLHDLLSGRYKEPTGIGMRMRIALGSAKGILYLHTEADPPIIHRDIKANNILIDSKFTAKVSDFGISHLAPVPDHVGFLPDHVSTIVKGTPGYVDPEYFLTHKLTEKSDVYSLGIVFLQLLTAMHPISHGKHIVDEVCKACKDGRMFSIIDQNLGSYPSDCIKKFMVLALRCCEDKMSLRPTMLEVVRELENISAMLPESDTLSSDPDGTSSAAMFASRSPTSSSSYRYHIREVYMSSDFGSNLVSGVIPTIGPR